jgi:ketosteroid isomerase-like protein
MGRRLRFVPADSTPVKGAHVRDHQEGDLSEQYGQDLAGDVRHQNVALVEKMYECFNKGDMDTIKKEVFAETLEWTLPGRNPVGGVKYGADEVIAFFGGLVRSGIRVDLVKIDAWGDDTVVEVHRGYGESKGAKLDALNCTHYHISDGRIAEVKVYMGDQYGADNFFWAAYELKPIPDRWAD